jgi:hypothetical protein
MIAVTTGTVGAGITITIAKLRIVTKSCAKFEKQKGEPGGSPFC